MWRYLRLPFENGDHAVMKVHLRLNRASPGTVSFTNNVCITFFSYRARHGDALRFNGLILLSFMTSC